MKKVVQVALVTFTLSVPAMSQAPPPAFVVTQFNDGTYWIVLRPYVYKIGHTQLSIEIPKGFVTDFASIPKNYFQHFQPTGQYARAAAIHDFLYWTQSCSREQADRLFLLAMIESDVPYALRQAIYLAVRTGGQPSWVSNQKEKESGMPRVIPEELLEIESLDVWSTYRGRLYKLGVRPEPTLTVPPSYCAADERDLH